MNIVQIIPSGTEDETLVPIQVVTRAQAKDNPEIQPQEPKQVPTKKQKHKTWRECKARLVAKKLKEEEAKQQQKRDHEPKETSSTNNSKHEGGSVLADKIFKPLDTLLMAYESRLKTGEPLITQRENYPDPALEKRRFAIC